jgi:hypothetical protein
MKKILIAGVTALLSTHSFAADAPAGPLAFPPIGNTLKANPKPLAIDAGPVGKINIGGVLSGLGYQQSNASATDDSSRLDISNAQLFLQKNSGLLQFYVQAGGYSIPALGTSYIKADDTTNDFYGVVPIAYVTLAPTDYFSISAGKLPTLIGAEYTYTFQNANIQRGLLWNQENAVNRGVQANFTADKLAVSVSVNDGFYSEDLSWLTGLATYTIDDKNSIAIAGGGNLDEDARATIETPLLQNNSQIYNLIYTHKTGPWTVMPYLQYSSVDADASIGITDDAETYGAALLTSYAVNDSISIAARGEYIDSSGGSNLLYGADSSAWSFTVTPTYQKDAFFVRAEASYVGINDGVAGSQFGASGNEDAQGRLLIETGLVF